MSEARQSVDSARVELYDIMQQETDFQDKAQAVLTLGRDYLEVENAHLTRINRDSDRWEIIATTDPPDATFHRGLTLDLNTTYCRRVVDEGSSIALQNAPEEGWADDPAFETHGLHCYHGTQITVDGDVYGTVCFVSESARDRPFSDADTLFAELIARLLEHELEHSKQVQETTRRANSITVLSRVLRHNLRNEMTVVRGRVSMLADRIDRQTDDDVDTAPLFQSIDRIIELSDKARKLESVVATQFDREPISLDPLFDRVVTTVTSQFPEADITIDTQGDVTISAAPSLELAITELVENAAKHAGPDADVVVTTTTEPDTVELSVIDNGPGLPEDEREVLASGVETPLIHGSGLGLWMVYWIVTTHDGTIDTTVTDEGTTVTVTLPQISDNSVVDTQDVRALQRGRDRFEAVFEESLNAMVILNDDQRIIDANKFATDILGPDSDDLLGRPFSEFTAPSFELAPVWEELQSAGQTTGEGTIIDADGTEHVLEYRAVADIIPGQHLIVGQDITERKQREAALERSERRYRTLAENFPNGIVLAFDHDLRYQSAHGHGFDEIGLEPSSLVGKRIDDLFEGELLDRLRDMYEATLQGEAQEAEFTFDGRYFETYTMPVRLDDGDVFAGIVMSQDVTKHKRRERDIHEAKERLDAVIQTSPNGIISLDSDGAIHIWNDAAEDIFGCQRSEVLGERLSKIDIFDDTDRAVVEERMQRSLQGESFTNMEVERRTADGEPLHLNLSSMPLTDPDGTITGVLAVAEDITSRKARVEELDQAYRQLRTVLDTAECAIFLKDSDGNYQIMNRAGKEMLGLDPDSEITGLTDFDLFPEDVAEAYRADDLRVLESGNSIEIEEAVPTEEGTRTYLTVKSPVLDENGVPQGVCGVGTDITAREDRNRLQGENERLEELIGIVSHDLRNPLQIARGNLELARATNDSEELKAVARAHARMEQLIGDLLTLAQQDTSITETESVDLASLIDECWENVDTSEATLVCNVTGVVEANRSRLAQLFENLIRNAVEHGGDDVTVRSGELENGFYIADDGPGIQEEDRDTVFEAGYSTNEAGTGFGLRIVKEVVEAHGWEITIADCESAGARFEITGVDFAE